MSKTYTRREMAYLLGCSPNTIYQDIQHLDLNFVIGDRGSKLYNTSDFNLISQLREHCADKSNSRDSFVPKTQVEIVEDEPQVTKLVKPNPAINQYQQSILVNLAQDPLFDLEMLQRISDNNWLLPSARLAPLLNISVGHLNSKQQYYYCGFSAIKEGYANGKVFWRIGKSNY